MSKITRSFNMELREMEQDRFDASLSSEFPVERWRGKEVLAHEAGAVDLSRAPLPLLASHDASELPVGIVENVRVEAGKLRGLLRFGESQRAKEALADVKAGILRSLSIGYVVQATEKSDGDSYRVTRWQPYEASLVAVPADPSVGIGRSFNSNRPMEGKKMDRNDLMRARKRALDGLEALATGETLPDDVNVAKEALEREIDGYDKRLSILDGLESRRKTSGNPAPGIPTPAGNAPTRDGGILILRPDEKLSACVRTGLPDGIRAEDLNLGRWLRGVVTGDWTGAEAERRSAMSEGTASLGGALVPTPLAARVIDAARNQAVIFKAGASTVPMTASTLKMARIDGDPTAYWRGEHEAVTESGMTFAPVTFQAKALAAMCRLSVELLEDASNVNSIVEEALGSALALELDRVALFGSGSGAEPKGLYTTSGIQVHSMGENGAALTSYAPFVAALEKLYTANAVPGAFVYSPRTWAALENLTDSTTGQPLMAPASFGIADKLVTGQVPNNLTHGLASNASAVICGEWPNLMVGLRTSLTIEATRVGGEDTFSKMEVLIRAYLRADVQVARASKFAVIKGIIPSSS